MFNRQKLKRGRITPRQFKRGDPKLLLQLWRKIRNQERAGAATPPIPIYLQIQSASYQTYTIHTFDHTGHLQVAPRAIHNTLVNNNHENSDYRKIMDNHKSREGTSQSVRQLLPTYICNKYRTDLHDFHLKQLSSHRQ